MASHGLIAAWDTLEGTLAPSATHTRSSGEWQTIHAGALVSYNTPSPVLQILDIALGAEARKAGTGVIGSVDETEYTLSIGSLGITRPVYLGAFTETPTARIEIDSVRLYNRASGTKWRVYFGEIRWYIGGSLHWSDATGGFVDGTGSFLTAASVPINGIPPTLSGSAAVNPALLLGVPPDYDFVQGIEAVVDGEVTGGWRVKVGSTWYQFPVTLETLAAPSISCSVSATLEFPEGENTYGGTAPIYAMQGLATTKTTELITECNNGPAVVVGEYEVYQTYASFETRLTSIGLWPNLAREIVRINNDYKALIVRGGKPELTMQSRSVCHDYVLDADTAEQVASRTVRAAATSFLEVVSNATATIEGVLTGDLLAPYSATAFRFEGRSTHVDVITPAACPLVEPEEPPGEPVEPFPRYESAVSNSKVSSFPIVQERTGTGGNPFILPYVDHTEGQARAWNTWYNPFWSFGPYLPANTYFDVASLSWKQLLWKVFGVGIETEYWATDRSQWLNHPSLPSSPSSRNHFVLDLLSDGALQTYTTDVFGIPSGYLGCSRFTVQEWTPDAEYQTSGSSGWSGVDCTLGFSGSDITVTPDLGMTDLEIRYAIGSWSYAPYMLLHLVETLTVDHELTNLTTINYYFEGQNGEKILIGSDPGTYQRPAGVDAKYAGSYGQEFGCGFITNVGSDSKASGISVATLLDPERAQHFSLLYGWDAKNLLIEVTVTGPITITQPVWTMPGSSGTVVQENGQMANVLFPRGAYRWGNRYWWDGASLSTTPIPSIKGIYHPTMLDALCERRVAFEGLERSDGLLTEIATLLDSVEGQTIEAADSNTFACIIGPNPAVDNSVAARAFLVNTLREVPPLAAWPMKRRNRVSFGLESGDTFEQAVFSYIQDYTRYSSARVAAHLKDGSDQWTSNSVSISVPNWGISEHKRAVDNNESTFSIVRGDAVGGEWGQARPWDGYFCVLDDSGAGGGVAYGDPHNTHTPDGRYCAVHIEDGNVRFRRAHFSTPIQGWAVDLLVTDDDDARYPRIAYYRKDGALYLYYSRDSLGSYLRISNDDGASWSDEVAVISGATHNASCTTPDGALILASVESGKIKAKAKGPGDSALSSQFNFKDESGVDLSPDPDYGFGLSYEPAGTAGILLHVRLSGETASSHWICTDWGGPTWAMSFKRIG